MNLCPCAGRGDPAAECSCSPQRLAAFRDKLSRALLDRFDLVVTVPRPRAEELAAGPAEPSAPVRARVRAARAALHESTLRRTAEANELLSRRGRAAAALRSRPRPRRAGRAYGRGARGRGRGLARARRGSARLPLAEGARDVNELALATFAAARDVHLVGEPRTARFAAFKASFDAGAELARLTALGLRFLARSDPGFPPLLRAIHDPPPGLFLRGEAEPGLLTRPAVAVVGARACSAYGRQIARSLGRELAAAGLVVVSGLARGIDAEAHRGALEGAGATVAVLGCGIDRDYPAAHRELRAADRGDRPRRRRVRAGRRAGALAVSGAESDRRGALRRDGRRRGT